MVYEHSRVRNTGNRTTLELCGLLHFDSNDIDMPMRRSHCRHRSKALTGTARIDRSMGHGVVVVALFGSALRNERVDSEPRRVKLGEGFSYVIAVRACKTSVAISAQVSFFLRHHSRLWVVDPVLRNADSACNR